MEREPGEPVTRNYPGVEVELHVLPELEERDVVLSALRKQLEGRVIDLDIYKERRRAYLETFLPEPPDQAA